MSAIFLEVKGGYKSFMILFALMCFCSAGCASTAERRKRANLAENRYRLGIYYLGAGSYGLAKKALNEAAELSGKKPKIYLALGRVYFAEKDFEKAEESFKKAASKDPENSEVHFYLGNLYLEKGEVEKALEMYARVEKDKDFPDVTSLYNNMGLAFLEKDDYPKSIQYFKEAIRYRSASPQAHYNLGIVYRKTGNREGALKELMRAVELYPGYVHAHLKLGETFMDMKDYVEAEKEFERVIELDRDSETAVKAKEYLKQILDYY